MPNQVLELPPFGRLIWNESDAHFEPNQALSDARTEEIDAGVLAALKAFVAGQFMLHGSCIARGTKAIALVGPSGAGKSTLAAMAVRRGVELVADGMTLFEPTSRQVIAGARRFKLTHESIERLGLFPEVHSVVNEDGAKRYVPVDGRPEATHVLTDAYCFADGGTLEVQSLSPHEQVMALVTNGMAASYLPPESARIHWERAAVAVNGGLRVHRLVRRKCWEESEHLTEFILQLLD